MSEPVLVTEGLCRRFGAVEALARARSRRTAAARSTAWSGPDGAGKTTAIRLVTGVIGPTLGRGAGSGAGPARRRVAVRDILGYMPQQYSLYGDLTVDENLRFFAAMFSLPARGLPRAPRAPARHHAARAASSTAAPTRCRAACTRSSRSPARCCTGPRLLVLDEPTNGVDPVSRREFWDLLARLRRRRHGHAALHAVHGRGGTLPPRGADAPGAPARWRGSRAALLAGVSRTGCSGRRRRARRGVRDARPATRGVLGAVPGRRAARAWSRARTPRQASAAQLGPLGAAPGAHRARTSRTCSWRGLREEARGGSA